MTKGDETKWGCAAVGCSGTITIDVDEACSDPERWQLCIEHPQLYLRFVIAGPQVVAEFLAFLQRHWNQPSHGELALGTIGNMSVSVIKDDEYVDRFFFCALSADGAVRYLLNSNEIMDYVVALKTAVAELNHRAT